MNTWGKAMQLNTLLNVCKHFFPIACKNRKLKVRFFYLGGGNWASEASPMLGCSIEISRDVYIAYYTSKSGICNS